MLKRAFAAALGLLLATPAGAQYFGRNKVQYDRFDFRILETPHFDIYYYAEERDAVMLAARMAERWYARLSDALDHRFERRQPIILYASHGHFAQTSVTPMFLGDGIGGLTDHQAGRVVLPFAAGLAETDHVLGHELVHAFQRDILRRHGSSLALLPLWFTEGMAEFLSVGRIDSNTAMWLRDAVNMNHLPRLEDLSNPRWFPYRYGQAVWAYLADRYGAPIIARALKVRTKGSVMARLSAATGATASTLSQGWRDAMKDLASATRHASTREADRTIVSSEHNGGRLNVGPALSPDGSTLVFLSERDGYSVDVYLADVKSGAIVRKLLGTATNPHIDTIQFIESAGAWDRTGRRFALAGVRDGVAMLTVFDMPSGAVSAEIPVPGVDEIFAPSWSPDGLRIAFSGLKGGAADLYLLTIESGSLRALTADMYADMQPSWSPDGSRIAFVTDRFSSSLDALAFGNYRLASIDVDSAAVRELPSIDAAKNIDPHWAPDGESVYFVADRAGISNIYRAWLDSGVVGAVTDVDTGVSGITALSPAMSVASRAGTIAYAAYRDGTYEIRELAGGEHAATPEPDAAPLEAQHTVSAIADLIGGSDGDAERKFLDKPYARGLSLFSMGPPYLSAGGGAFGSFVRAGVSFGFGDILGEQELETAIQIGKDVMDFAVQTAYLNRRSRWTWGVVAGQIPFVTGWAQSARIDVSGGQPTVVRESVLEEQVHRQASALFAYPFNRAKRIELSAGVDSITFHTDLLTNVYSATGRRLLETRERRPGLADAMMIQSGVALVYDTSVHGPASPVLGERYRIGISPAIGDLSLATVVGDYRKYVMPLRPFTMAMRLQHIGRYGRGADDPRLLPFVWLVQDVVRGYDGRELPGGCNQGSGSCDTIDAATTKRLLAANLELRFPIVGALQGTTSYGKLPLEGLLFTDAGAFWTSRGAGLTRTSIRSVGGGVRLNAGGLVFEFDAARPVKSIDPQFQGWRLSVNFRPGF